MTWKENNRFQTIMEPGAAPGVEGTPPNPDIVDEPPGLDVGFEIIPFENVLWIKQEFNKDEPIFTPH